MSAARTERLLNLLTLLLNSRRPISLREIREYEEFDAYQSADPKSGERAFERDKAALVELGVPLRWVSPEEEDDEDGIGGYVIDKDRYFLPELELSPAELALLSIAGAAAAAIEGFPGRPTVIRALAKLGFDVDQDRPFSLGLAHAPIREAPDRERVAAHLQLLHDAVARQRRVRMVYEARDGQETTREVDPWGMYYRHGVWYLVGYCHLRAAERTFHLGRVKDAVVSNPERRTADFEVPDSFDLSVHVRQQPWELATEPPREVVIRIGQRLLPAVPEIFGSRAEIETTPDGALLRLRVTHSAALIAAVLPFGADAEILEPEDLRQRIATIYRDLSRVYASAGPKEVGA